MSTTTMLTFPPSNVTGEMCTTIRIVNDIIIESSEQFSVALISVSPVGIIMENITCITIIDDDRKAYCAILSYK